MPTLRQSAWGVLARLSSTVLHKRGEGTPLSVLNYHSVSAQPEPLGHADVDAATFEMHLEVLASACTVLPLGEAARRLRDGTLPPCAACITFDDGYADNVTRALPMLQRHGLSATFFIATGYLDGGRMFNDVVIEALRRCDAAELDLVALDLGRHPLHDTEARARAIGEILGKVKRLAPDVRAQRVAAVATAAGVAPAGQLMMTREQVRALADAGMEIGCHTHTHPILTSVPPEQARADIAENKRELEDIIGRPVTVFAYPNGKPIRDYGAEHVAMVREAGFEAAVSTARGVAHGGSDPLQLPRFTPWDATPERFLARLVMNWRSTRYEVAA